MTTKNEKLVINRNYLVGGEQVKFVQSSRGWHKFITTDGEETVVKARAKDVKPLKVKHSPTLFLVRNLQAKSRIFHKVSRAAYKAKARACSEGAVPFRTAVEYRNGRPVKLLTIHPPVFVMGEEWS